MEDKTLGVPIKAFYQGAVLVGVIRSVSNGHVHMFYGESGEGRELTSFEFWDRIRRVGATEHFVINKDTW